jgi:hypothetical protein
MVNSQRSKRSRYGVLAATRLCGETRGLGWPQPSSGWVTVRPRPRRAQSDEPQSVSWDVAFFTSITQLSLAGH